jgi:hypothetical protein
LTGAALEPFETVGPQELALVGCLDPGMYGSIAGMSHLHELSLPENWLDAGLQQIAGHPALRVLCVHFNRVPDWLEAFLRSFPALERVNGLSHKSSPDGYQWSGEWSKLSAIRARLPTSTCA